MDTPSAPFEPKGIKFFDNASKRDMILITETGYHMDGWLAYQHPDGQWVSLRKATPDDYDRIVNAGRAFPIFTATENHLSLMGLQPVRAEIEPARPKPPTFPCSVCGQSPTGQSGEYPCAVCGLPTLHDDDTATFKIDYRHIAEQNRWFANVDMQGAEGNWHLLAPNHLVVFEGDEYAVGKRLAAIGRELLHHYVATTKGWTTADLCVIGPCDEILKYQESLTQAEIQKCHG